MSAEPEQTPELYKLWISENRRILVRLWPNEMMEVVTRQHPDEPWGPPVWLERET